MNMEIILKEDVKNLGHKYDIVKVRPGYARNYLIPKGYAIEATPSTKKMVEEIKKQRALKEEKLKQEALNIAQKLEGASITIKTKATSTGKIFGSVNNIHVAETLKEIFDIDVDRKKIDLQPEIIKELGNYTASIHLHRDVVCKINIQVEAEE